MILAFVSNPFDLVSLAIRYLWFLAVRYRKAPVPASLAPNQYRDRVGANSTTHTRLIGQNLVTEQDKRRLGVTAVERMIEIPSRIEMISREHLILIIDIVKTAAAFFVTYEALKSNLPKHSQTLQSSPGLNHMISASGGEFVSDPLVVLPR